MNTLKLTLAFSLAVAAGLMAGVSPARAVTMTPVIQTLATPELTAAQFNSMFKAIDAAPEISSDVNFYNTPGTAGTLRSQVFAGQDGTAAAGLYAYAYQLSVNSATNTAGEPVHIDSASWQFNATPAGTDFAGTGHATYAYVVKDHAIGNLIDPAGAAGGAIRTPTNLSWQPGQNIGAIRADYVDPSSQNGPLSGGDKSATFVVISKQPWSNQFQYAGVLSSNPQQGAPAVYSASGGPISPVPVPEPATILAWAGMAGAAVLVRRVRKARTV